MHVVVGHSEDVDTSAALDEVLERVRAGLCPEFGPPRAVLLFATFDYDREQVVRGVRAAFPELPLLGCTVDGISSSAQGYHEDALAVVVFCGERLRAALGIGRDLSADSRGAGAVVADAVRATVAELGSEPRLCLSFSESLTVGGAQILDGLVRGVGAGIPVLGGTSTDDLRFERAYQFYGDEVLSDSAPFLLLGGELAAAWCAGSGWFPVGVEGQITDCEGPVVRRVGDESALAFYQRYLGEDLHPSSDNPLAVYEPDKDADVFYLRAPLSVDEATGAITFLGPIPPGATVRVSETCRDEILEAARRAGERAREGLSGEPGALLFFSCASRKNQLGTRTSLELDMLRGVTGSGCPAFGVYTYGEFGSLTPQGPSHFLNQSIVALLLGDA